MDRRKSDLPVAMPRRRELFLLVGLIRLIEELTQIKRRSVALNSASIVAFQSGSMSYLQFRIIYD